MPRLVTRLDYQEALRILSIGERKSKEKHRDYVLAVMISGSLLSNLKLLVGFIFNTLIVTKK